MKLSKLSALAVILLSNAVLAESYQSFTTLSYSHDSYFVDEPEYGYYHKRDSDNFALFSKYYFDERVALGPLNEFSYINTSSNVFASAAYQNRDGSSLSYGGNTNFDSSINTYRIGGQWIINSFILGASYDYNESKRKWNDYNYDNNDSDVSLLIGYLFSDNFLISLGCNEGRRDNDRCGIGAQYNWQLDGTDYIGVKYNFDGDLEDHYLSSQYFFSVGEQSYVKLGVDYNYFNFKHLENEDYWHVNASYYFNASTSISTFYGENDFYGVSASYFFNDNYSLAAGYNSANLDRADESEGYFFTLSAQF